MSSTEPVLVNTPSTMRQPAGSVCRLYPRQAEVVVPSKSDRQPAARCSAVKEIAHDAVVLALSAGGFFPIGVQAPTASANCVIIAARAAVP